MKTLEGRPKFEVIKEPKGDERLDGFSTGSEKRWEIDVNKLVRELFESGRRLYPSLTTVAMRSESGDVLGLCAWRPKKLGEAPAGETAEPPSEPPYIHLIGISEPYRGCRTEDGEHLGCALLVVALEAMKQQWTGSEMPDVWALVHPLNTESHELLRRHGFGLIRKPSGDYRRYRPPGLPIF